MKLFFLPTSSNKNMVTQILRVCSKLYIAYSKQRSNSIRTSYFEKVIMINSK